MALKEKIIIEHHTRSGWEVFGSAMAVVYADGMLISKMEGITEDMRIVHDGIRFHIGCIEVVGFNDEDMMITVEDCD
jgi:hypothetical protein